MNSSPEDEEINSITLLAIHGRWLPTDGRYVSILSLRNQRIIGLSIKCRLLRCPSQHRFPLAALVLDLDQPGSPR
ncbi:hypothetical protein [Methyloglobulus sp.]|uniref:hypothetical protein n=1 Tax=Methyloglobulus sp. TaxID=2518622 RepID=UPI0039890E5F